MVTSGVDEGTVVVIFFLGIEVETHNICIIVPVVVVDVFIVLAAKFHVRVIDAVLVTCVGSFSLLRFSTRKNWRHVLDLDFFLNV